MTVERAMVEVRPAPEGTTGLSRVLMLPGSGYTIDHPLLFWTAEALESAGWQVSAVRWDARKIAGDPMSFVEAAAAELEHHAPPAERTLVVGKSLGSYAARWAAERGWPAVWLTPLMTEPLVGDAITTSSTPTLAIGGTKDAWWVPPLHRPGLEIAEIDDANHSLHHPAWRDSMETLAHVTGLIERFAASLP